MRTKSTLVGIFFVLAGLLTAWLMATLLATVFATLRVTDAHLVGDTVTLTRLLGIVVAGIAAVGFYTWPKTKNFVGACAEELNKVNWPSWSETKTSTLVVIVTSIIAAMILGVFDITFAFLSNWLADNV